MTLVFHDIGLQCPCQGGGRTGASSQNLVPSSNYCILNKSFKKVIFLQLLIRKHSYLDHGYPVGLALIPRHRSPGSMKCGLTSMTSDPRVHAGVGGGLEVRI